MKQHYKHFYGWLSCPSLVASKAGVKNEKAEQLSLI